MYFVTVVISIITSIITTNVVSSILSSLLPSLLLLSLPSAVSYQGSLSEPERVEQWIRLYGQWPYSWQQESDELKRHHEAREAEIMAIPGADERWENWMQYIQHKMVPTFTDRGFDVINTPPSIHAKLLAAVERGIENWDKLRIEEDVEAIYSHLRPKFVDIGDLQQETIQELRELHEEWAGGIELEATSAYGVRLYQNGSSLIMHHDKIHTHVISSIVHIAHKYDDDDVPWPIQIEDHDGNMHAVNLEPGQMLFYESAKCLHGRMQEFKGTYYGSIFLHYKPVDTNLWHYDVEDVINNVPPHWNENLVEDHGSRWAGQGLTIDSLAVAGAPDRVINGEFVHAKKSPHAHPKHAEL